MQDGTVIHVDSGGPPSTSPTTSPSATRWGCTARGSAPTVSSASAPAC
jgi:hypothetical protein